MLIHGQSMVNRTDLMLHSAHILTYQRPWLGLHFTLTDEPCLHPSQLWFSTHASFGVRLELFREQECHTSARQQRPVIYLSIYWCNYRPWVLGAIVELGFFLAHAQWWFLGCEVIDNWLLDLSFNLPWICWMHRGIVKSYADVFKYKGTKKRPRKFSI